MCVIFPRVLLLLRAVRKGHVPRRVLHQPRHVYQVAARWLLLRPLSVPFHAHSLLLCWQDTGWLPHISLVENV